MIQKVSDKTSTTLKANATMVYLVQIGLLNFIEDFRRVLVNHGHTIDGLMLTFVSESAEKSRNVDAAKHYGLK